MAKKKIIEAPIGKSLTFKSSTVKSDYLFISESLLLDNKPHRGSIKILRFLKTYPEFWNPIYVVKRSVTNYSVVGNRKNFSHLINHNHDKNNKKIATVPVVEISGNEHTINMWVLANEDPLTILQSLYLILPLCKDVLNQPFMDLMYGIGITAEPCLLQLIEFLEENQNYNQALNALENNPIRSILSARFTDPTLEFKEIFDSLLSDSVEIPNFESSLSHVLSIPEFSISNDKVDRFQVLDFSSEIRNIIDRFEDDYTVPKLRSLIAFAKDINHFDSSLLEQIVNLSIAHVTGVTSLSEIQDILQKDLFLKQNP